MWSLSANRRIFATRISHVITAVMLAGPMLLAAAAVAALVELVAVTGFWPRWGWLVFAPALYFAWLILYLVQSALICRQLGKRYPKPRRITSGPRRAGADVDEVGSLTAITCSRRLMIVETLPLARALAWVPGLSTLVLRAYSPSVHLGRGVINFGLIHDPDLTEVGEGAVLGGHCAIVAHAMTIREDGVVVYTSAPIRIGRRVTIGGGAFVSLGCVIEDDAILEQGSVAAPFTHIPAGEVWAGNPASFRRKRRAALTGPPAVPVRTTDALQSGGTATAPSAWTSEAREVVVNALQLSAADAVGELSNTTCAAWDSLGQVAIAAALFDRYGIVVSGSDVFGLHTVSDVAGWIARRRSAPNEPDTNPSEVRTGRLNAAGRSGFVLPDDAEMLPLMDPHEATRALAARFDREPAAPDHVRVCIAASFTAQQLAPALRVWGRAFGFEIECGFAAFDQIVPALLDREGPFAANADGVNVVLTRPEDLLSDSSEDPMSRLEYLLGAVRSAVAQSQGRLLVGTLPPVVSASAHVSHRVVSAMRERWTRALDELPSIDVLDFGRTVEHLGVERARNAEAEVLARAPYSPEVYQLAAISLARAIRAARRAPAKVIVLDCDNTLWGGVVGEVGLAGIQLGSDGPGRAFQLFQRHLKAIQRRGVLLVVASKNEAQDVLEVFREHPEMLLRTDDIAAWRVSWQPKSESIRELAQELRLGLDSFVLLDDDPVVRMEVKSLVPEVHVPSLPDDPARFGEMLERLWLFDSPRHTVVDEGRTRMTHEEARRQQESKSAGSLDDFLAQLELRVEMGLMTPQECPRISQLTQRTNQFNLSLKRRTLEEVQRAAVDRSVIVGHAQDRFGHYGLIGTCMLAPPDESGVSEIDTLLMSCRALGRGIEDAFLHGVATVAVREGASALLARFVQGPRNAQVKVFLARCGFAEMQPDVFLRALDELPPLPRHIRFDERALPHQGQSSLSPAQTAESSSASAVSR